MIDNNEIPKKGLISDGSYQKSKKLIQWRVMNIETGEFVWENGLYSETPYIHNLAEYFGIVKCIKYCIDNDLNLVCYTDSMTSLSWLNSGVNTSITNPKLLKLVKAGEQYIKFAKEYLNYPKVEKWLSSDWGENLSDYGFK